MRLATLQVPVLVLAAACTARDDPQRLARALQPDYPGATYAQALAYTKGRQKGFQPSFIVVHVAQGYYKGTISWFQDPKSGVSSHYVVSTTGLVTQMVEEVDTAYHVGSGISALSVGIEHEGFVADPQKWFTDAMYKGSAELVKNITERWGIPRDRCHILGHNEVPDPDSPCTFGGAEHHTDPGTGWDWTKYMGYIGGPATACPWDCKSKKGNLVGVVRAGGLLPSAKPIAGAKVSIGSSNSTTTDQAGFYRFDNLDQGYFYQLTVNATGFLQASQYQAVVIPLDAYSNFALTAAPLSDAGPAKSDAAVSTADAKALPSLDRGRTPEAQPPPAPDVEPPPAGEEGGSGGGGCALGSPAAVPRGSLAALLVLVALFLLARRRRATSS